MEATAQGTLAKTPLAHLVVYCLERKLTGTLVLLPAGAPTPSLKSSVHLGHADVIRFEDGYPAKVRVPQLVEHLGKVLLDLALLPEKAMNEAVAAVHRGEGLLGQILLRRGVIDEATLQRGLQAQLRRKLALVFERPEATTFAFYEGVDLLVEYGAEGTPIDPLPLVFAAVRSRPSIAHVDAALAKVAQARLRLRPSSDLSRFDLSRSERALGEALRDQPRTVEELQQTPQLDPARVRVVVYGLLLVKQLEVASARATAAAPGSSAAGTPPLSSRPDAARTSSPSAPPTAPSGARIPSGTHSSPRVPTGPHAAVKVPPQPNAAARVPTGPHSAVKIPAAPASPAPTTVRPPRPPSPSGPSSTNTRAAKAIDLAHGPKSHGSEALVAADPARVQEIRERVAKIADQNYFEMLGVGRECSADDARDAYVQLAKRWHPDRLPMELEPLRSEVEQIFRHFTEAFTTLSDAEKRKNYLRVLAEGGGTPREQAEVARLLEAAQQFRKAQFFVGKGAFAEAEPFVRQAYELAPEEPEHLALWCWFESRLPERRTMGRYDDLIERCTEALTKAPQSELVRFYRAMIFKQAGRTHEAIREFKIVAEANPRNIDAVREVRLHQMRLEKEKPRKEEGLLGKLIPRKK